MSIDHIQRLTACNRQLVADLNAARAFIGALLDPEQYGHAVTEEVRNEARRVLGKELTK